MRNTIMDTNSTTIKIRTETHHALQRQQANVVLAGRRRPTYSDIIDLALEALQVNPLDTEAAVAKLKGRRK